MSASWRTAPLGELMRQRPPDVKVEATERYQFAGVYSFARGVFRAQERMGTETSYRVLSRLAVGEFVYPKLMAWEGGFGVVPPECDGCYVSPEFPVFEIDQRKMLPRWIDLFFKVTANWKAIAGVSTGTNMRRQRLQPSDLLTNTIPLPPLAEQRRIVSRIDALASKINEARGLRDGAAAEVAVLMKQHMSNVFDSDHSKYRIGDEKWCQIICGQHLAPEEQAETGLPYITGPADFTERTAAPSRFALVDRACSEKGDVLLTVKGAGVGKLNLAPDQRTAIGRQLFALRPRPSRLNQMYLWYVTQHSLRHFRDAITATTVPGIGRSDVESLAVPIPSLEEQSRVVAALDALQATVDAVKRLQVETAAELDALLPAILDRAFKGEL